MDEKRDILKEEKIVPMMASVKTIQEDSVQYPKSVLHYNMKRWFVKTIES